MTDPNQHPLTIKPASVDVDRIADLLRLHGTDPHTALGRRLASSIAGSPILTGTLIELADGKWAVPTFAPSVDRVDAPIWRRFEAWCTDHGQDPLPTSTETVLRYLANLADTISPGAVRLASRAISHTHRKARLPDPTRDISVVELLVGIERSAREQGRPLPQPRPLADFEDVRRLVDVVGQGGYWKRYLDTFERDRLSVARLLEARWRAIILTEWAGSLDARQTLWATIDDLHIGSAVSLALPETIENPTGIQVRILGFEEKRYDPHSALADWIELLLRHLPPCRTLFPSIYLRPTPTVVCKACGPGGGSPHPSFVPAAVESSLSAAVRNDGTAFTGIADSAGIQKGGRVLTRTGLRMGVRAEANRHDVSQEEIRRQLRLTFSGRADAPPLSGISIESEGDRT